MQTRTDFISKDPADISENIQKVLKVMEEKYPEHIKQTQGAIKMYILPGYSPDLNPDELVWSAAKKHIQRKLIRTKKELEKEIASFLHRIQKSQGYISNLFKHPNVSYITES